jgi:hypothetical protein
MFEFKSGTFYWFTFIFVRLENRVCLSRGIQIVSWYVGGRCDMTCSDENYDRSRRPGAED